MSSSGPTLSIQTQEVLVVQLQAGPMTLHVVCRLALAGPRSWWTRDWQRLLSGIGGIFPVGFVFVFCVLEHRSWWPQVFSMDGSAVVSLLIQVHLRPHLQSWANAICTSAFSGRDDDKMSHKRCVGRPYPGGLGCAISTVPYHGLLSRYFC